MTKAAIMQPTYLPWCGYFGLIDIVDIFVIYDDVQFEKRSWQQRNKIKTTSGSQWLTVPVDSKGKRFQKINEVCISEQSNFSKDHIRAIEVNYSKTKYFKEYKNAIFDCISNNQKYLLDLNQSIIFELSKILELQTDFINSSKLKVSGKKEERLVNICKHLSAAHYIATPGAKIYLDGTDAFEKNEIKLSYQSFTHPIYPQINGNFLSHMGIIDILFNCGPRKTLELIRESCIIENL